MVASFDELYLKTSDNIKISLNHYKAGANELLIIAPGWTMSKDSNFISDIASLFAESIDVIAFDFRGHGKSSGAYTFTSKEYMDLDAVINYAKKYYSKIYLLGFSLGAATSIIHCAKHNKVHRLITVSAPHSLKKINNLTWIKDFIENPFKKYEFEKWIKVRPYIPHIFANKMTKPIDVVDRVIAPALFIAGNSDSITKPNDTKSLFDKALCKKHFELFDGCNHAEDLIHQEKEKLVNICLDWLAVKNGT